MDEFDDAEDYHKVVYHDGVRVTLGRNRFEVAVVPGNDVWEQQTVQFLRDWIRWRKSQEEAMESRAMRSR